MQVRADAVAEVFGSGEFIERMKRRQGKGTIAAADAAFLRRIYSSPTSRPMMVLPLPQV